MKNPWISGIVILLSLILSVRAIATIIDLRARKYTVTERKNSVESVKKDNATLKKELDAIHSDEYVEKIARDKLGMVKEGEAIILLPDEAKGGEKKSQSRIETNWQRWWELFF